jgi:hypothetical protein
MLVSEDIEKCVMATQDHNSLEGLQSLNDGGLYSFTHTGGEGSQTLYIGDSNMQQYAPRIVRLMMGKKDNDRGCIFLTSVGVPPIDHVTNPSKPRCTALVPKVQEVINSDLRIDRVVIAARWDAYFLGKSKYLYQMKPMTYLDVRKSALEELGRKINALVIAKKKVTLVLSIPSGLMLDPKSFFKRDFFGVHSSVAVRFTKDNFLKYTGDLLLEIASVARGNGAEVIDPLDYLCKDGVCIAEDPDGPIRYDATHLRPKYVREKVKYLDFTVDR